MHVGLAEYPCVVAKWLRIRSPQIAPTVTGDIKPPDRLSLLK